MNCSVQELKEKLARGDDFVLLDVRTEEELAIVKIEGCVHIALHELEAGVGQLAGDKEREILCLCHHGGRSAMAQRFLLSAGFKDVKNVPGGIHAYAEQVDPSLATYG